MIVKNIVEITTKYIENNEAYEKMKASPTGGASLCEIIEDGDLQIMSVYPRVTTKEIRDFSKEYSLYYFESDDKAALILDGCRIEMTINPSYYNDDRFSILMNKDVVHLHSYLIDSKLDEVVAFNCVEIKGRQLESLKKCLLLNANVTREQYDYWIFNVLYARSFEENIGRSIRIGKLRKPENVDCIII